MTDMMFFYQQDGGQGHSIDTTKREIPNYTEISYDELQIQIETWKSTTDTEQDIIDVLLDGVAGILLYPAKIVPLLIGRTLETVMGLFAEDGLSLTLDEILFNKVEILSIDFFNLNPQNGMVKTIRENVAIWYYGIRNLSATILFVILLYTGLRMAISTAAEEKARYSEMIVNWLISIALLFVLHYIMEFVIVINNRLVSIFATALTNNKGDTIDMIDQFFVNSWSLSFTEGLGSALAYLALVGMTFVFLLAYLKRMITIAFLIVISPLVTVTYSLDKMGDNKSQALDNWLKEFAYNVLIQPFQCAAYLALVESAMKILTTERSLSAVVVAFIMIVFLYEAEKIIKLIFGFNPQSMSDTVGHAAYYATIMNNANSIATGAKNKYTSKTAITPQNETKNEKSFGKNVSPNAGTLGENNNQRANALAKGGKVGSGQKGTSRINNALSKVTSNGVFQAGVTANKIASKMILGVGLSGATGEPTTMLSAGASAIKNGFASGRKYSENRNRHALQQSYKAAENEAREDILNERVRQKMGIDSFDELTDEQRTQANSYRDQIERDEGDDIDLEAKELVRQRADAIANGAEPETEAEEQLQDSIGKLSRSYKNNGMSDKNINTQISNDFASIRAGGYSEATDLEIGAKNAMSKAKDVADVIASTVKDVKKYYRKKNS